MPPLVTTAATIMCIHGGQVMLTPRQTTVLAGGSPVLREGDLSGAPIVGCLQPPSPGTKPCTMVISTLPGSASTHVMAAGAPVLLQTLSGITDGVPPGAIMVASPGQATAQAI
jgi:hypothetical protein